MEDESSDMIMAWAARALAVAPSREADHSGSTGTVPVPPFQRVGESNGHHATYRVGTLSPKPLIWRESVR